MSMLVWSALSYTLGTLCALAALPVLVLFAQVLLAHGGSRAHAVAAPRRPGADVAVLADGSIVGRHKIAPDLFGERCDLPPKRRQLC